MLSVTVILLFLLSHEGKVFFSVESGIYNSPFELTLKAPFSFGKIYYTVDGSDPRDNGIAYSNGIVVDNNIDDHSNKLMAYKNVTWLEILGMKTYYPKEDLVFPYGVVVRSAIRDIFGRWSDVSTATYFFGDISDSMPIISLVINEEDFFGKDGIYITGEEYDAAAALYSVDESLPESQKLLNAQQIGAKANYSNNQRVKCYIEEIYGDDELDGEADIKLFGAFSRGYPQKSFSLSYNTEKTFVFNEGEYSLKSKEIKLRNGGSGGTKQFLNDYIIQKIGTGLNCDNVQQKNVVVFLNGEYWGIYQVYEKLSADLLNKKYPETRSSDLINIVKSGLLETGDKKQYKAYKELMDEIKNADTINDELWDEINEQIDIDSYADCYLINIFFGNTDYINHNTYAWQYYDTNNGKWSKWRCALYDLDSTFGCSNIVSNIELYDISDLIFSKLITRDEFKVKLIERAEDIISNNLEEERVGRCIEEIKSELNEYIFDYYRRYGPLEYAELSKEQAQKVFFEYVDGCEEYIDNCRLYFCDILSEYLGVAVHNLGTEDYIIDFSNVPKEQFIKTRGIYLGESEAVWAENGAEIEIKIAAGNDISIDFSNCYLQNHTNIFFNEKKIWDYREGIEKLRKVIVPEDYINQGNYNTIRLWTSNDIDYSNESDPRQLCFRFSRIVLSENITYDDESSFILDFTSVGNLKEYVVSDLFYDPESEGTWGQNGAYIDLFLEGQNDMWFDFSNISYADMIVLFNGETIWDSKENLDKKIKVNRELIEKKSWNRLEFRTREEVNSPKDLGISDDPRYLTFYFKSIEIDVVLD